MADKQKETKMSGGTILGPKEMGPLVQALIAMAMKKAQSGRSPYPGAINPGTSPMMEMARKMMQQRAQQGPPKSWEQGHRTASAYSNRYGGGGGRPRGGGGGMGGPGGGGMGNIPPEMLAILMGGGGGR